MKLIFILSMYLIPMIGLAQSVWEAPNARIIKSQQVHY